MSKCACVCVLISVFFGMMSMLKIFTLLYTPCVAAIAAVKREMGAKWVPSVIFMQCAIAWVCSFIFKLVGTLLGAV